MNIAREFRFTSGRLSLDLPATVRRRASEPHDVLASVGAPARWLRDASLVQELLTLSPLQEAELFALREAIWAATDAASAGKTFPAEAVGHLNAAAARPLAMPQLDVASGTVRLVADDPFGTAMATIARDAVELLGGPLRSRIKECDQPDCRMLFLDMSRSSRRRWCSMDRCGSRSKGETFRQRHKGGTYGHSAG